jgi:two-component system, NarL family, sensor kinase
MLKETIPEDIRLIIITVAIIFTGLAAFIIFFILLFNKRKNKLINDKQLMKTQFEQALLQTQIEIQEQTLKTISQEIHDNIGQVLSLAKLNLNTFEDAESANNQIKINDTKNLVSKAINDLRDLSRSLHGDKIAELGLQESVENELKILQNTGQYITELKITGEPYKLAPQKEMVLFRIVQEAMNNAIKHAKAKNIFIEMKYQPDKFDLIITDDGIGFNVTALQTTQTGIGLKSMQNRAALIGGEFSINSSVGKGTEIKIELKK